MFKFIHRGRGVTCIYNDKLYYRKKIYKSNAEWWRCCNNKENVKCNGSITIKNEVIIKQVSHKVDCKTNVAKIAWLEKLEMCKENVAKTDLPISELYQNAVSSYKDTGYSLVQPAPDFDAIKSGLFRKRNKSLGIPKMIHDNVANIVIPNKFDDFLLADYNCDGVRIILFCSIESRSKIRQLKHFFGDGTFKVCPKPFCQIYSIHGDCGSDIQNTNITPLIYALMSHKDYNSYNIMFKMIISQISEDWKPMQFTCDYEYSTMKAISSLFPDCIVKGCYYHFRESLRRKGKSLNIDNSKNNRRCINLCSNLALLPEQQIIEGLNYIVQQYENRKEVQSFLNYFKTYWMKSSFVKKWCVYGERHRTNNYIEGWHLSLNNRFRRNNQNLLQVLNAFKRDANMIRNPRKRRQTSQINDEIIQEAQLSLFDERITVGHFLEMLR